MPCLGQYLADFYEQYAISSVISIENDKRVRKIAYGYLPGKQNLAAFKGQLLIWIDNSLSKVNGSTILPELCLKLQTLMGQ